MRTLSVKRTRYKNGMLRKVDIPSTLFANHPITINETTKQVPKKRTIKPKTLVQKLDLASLITMLSLPSGVYLVVIIASVVVRKSNPSENTEEKSLNLIG